MIQLTLPRRSGRVVYPRRALSVPEFVLQSGIRSLSPSEKLSETGDLQRVRLVGTCFLDAESWSWKDFAGIRDVFGIESATHELHRVEIRLGEHQRHESLLLCADAVLACDRAASLDTQLHDFKGKLFSQTLLPRH